MEGCGGKDEQSNLFKGNNDTGTIIVLTSLQSKPTRSVDKVFVCRSRDHNSNLWTLIWDYRNALSLSVSPSVRLSERSTFFFRATPLEKNIFINIQLSETVY